jgi:hypothetical protein
MSCFITFIYCTECDDGIMIKGHHDYVPDNYTMAHSTRCTYRDWYNVGVIKCEEGQMKVVERLRIDYNRFCGGFHFRGYLHTLTDETGNNLEMDEDSVLYEWIEEMAKNKVDTFLDPE